ncbi:MAG TPA: TIGR04076 family protein [Thermomicrobiales bacterium]|nr:TIGR04076 family protein [Thermomicrobiales bacterium]
MAVETFALANLRVTVVAIEGRSVCGLQIGDWFEVTDSSRVRIPAGRHFCLYALAAILPLLPAKMRVLDPDDWLAHDNLVACPDPDERLIMRIERLETVVLDRDELT